MRIHYDGLIFNIQPVGGIVRYFSNLITHLPAQDQPGLSVPQGYTPEGFSHPQLTVRSVVPRGRLSRWERLRSLAKFGKDGYDVAHPTYYGALESTAIRAPSVLTVHDFIHEQFQSSLDPDQLWTSQKRISIERADAIICVSHSTYADLERFYPQVVSRAQVVHQASSLTAELSHGPQPVPEQPYILFVGTRHAYKNFLAVLRALRAGPPELILSVTGPPFTQEECHEVERCGLSSRVVHLGRVTDPHLAKLYRCSRALVYPSLYEGFGIPVLEAMACGTLAISSNTSSLPEVAGPAGLMFDPARENELVDLIKFASEDSVQRDNLVQAGRQQAASFSWAQTASKTRDVYRQLCD